MAIIKPSLKFQGSELGLTNSGAPYIKEDVKRAIFNKTTNVEGAFLYILPAYKEDPNGDGVWFKHILIRDAFGTAYREKYYIPNLERDPAEYFAKNYKMLYPEEAKTTEEEVNGKKFKKYPPYGRVAHRMLYNVAYCQNLNAGAQVLDLPLHNGASIIHEYLQGKDMEGNPIEPLNDPDRCLPITVKLKEGSSNPWSIQIGTGRPIKLPVQLADTDYLNNLDDILVHKSNDDIIAKLRDMFPRDIFDECMDGFSGLTKAPTRGHTFETPVKTTRPAVKVEEPEEEAFVEAQEPEVLEAPAIHIEMPKLNKAKKAAAAAKATGRSEVIDDPAALPPNPMTRTKADALRFLQENE